MAESKNETAKSAKRSSVSVKEVKTDLRKEEPPLVDIKVSNPVTYLKTWWRRVIGNEGIEFKFRVRPLTAIAITIVVVTVTLGIGRFRLPFKIPFFEYNSLATPTPEVFRETGFVGELKYNSDLEKYFLITSSSESLNLEVPESVELEDLIGRRIFATGKYYPDSRNLIIESVEDLEILPKVIEPVPTISPIPSATPSPEPEEDSATDSAETN